MYYTDPDHRKFPGKDYDGSDSPENFQKYLGYGYEKRTPNLSRWVDETNGEMVTYNGTVIKPWYFSSSNGQTVSYKQYCEARKSEGSYPKNMACQDIPYLQSVSDPGGVGQEQAGHGVGLSGVGAEYMATNL